MKKGKSKAHFGSDIAGTTRERPCRASADFFAYRLLHIIDVNIENSSRTVNYQLY